MNEETEYAISEITEYDRAIEKRYELEELYDELYLDNLQARFTEILGDDADDIRSAIATMDYEIRQEIRRLIKIEEQLEVTSAAL